MICIRSYIQMLISVYIYIYKYTFSKSQRSNFCTYSAHITCEFLYMRTLSRNFRFPVICKGNGSTEIYILKNVVHIKKNKIYMHTYTYIYEDIILCSLGRCGAHSSSYPLFEIFVRWMICWCARARERNLNEEGLRATTLRSYLKWINLRKICDAEFKLYFIILIGSI